ncbi:plasmid maintenance system killer protein [Thioploca ingrica]|uniref:Plasmid maintenance system killer protein n=1 Tax=Thioploca ingrica TaxID=40754 RepID=A0A090AMA2_9GAMM|nr:plasmid maintenance system killer protein [Thioploca ingrica]
MIKSFKHKGLKQFFCNDKKNLLNPQQCDRISRLLDRLEAAEIIEDMNLPSYGLHQLTGDKKNRWSVKVSGNWRITFRFEEGQAYEVDLEDYH